MGKVVAFPKKPKMVDYTGELRLVFRTQAGTKSEAEAGEKLMALAEKAGIFLLENGYTFTDAGFTFHGREQ